MADRNADFDALVRDYYRAWFRFHPEEAVEAGVAGYADLLTPYGDDDIGALLALNENLLGALDELDAERLDAQRRLDYRILYAAAGLEHWELMEWDWRRRDPVRYLPVHAVYQLIIRPVAGFREALIARLEAIPGHLRGAARQLTELPALIPPLWLESAITEAQEGAQYLRHLPGEAKVARAFPNPGRVAAAAEEGARSLETFARFLETELAGQASGDFACGSAHFERILRDHHFLELDASRLHRFGHTLYEVTLAELRAVTRELRGDEDIAALTRQLQQQRPEGDLLAAYREQMQAAHQLVADRDLVTIPDTQRLQVVETPTFLRHRIPFAAYVPPVPSDPDQVGLYYVTPPASEADWAEHNALGLRQTCVHEAWPGHHLQFVTANRHPPSCSLPRLLNPSAILYEGWALYCEQLMLEQGFGERPEQRFVLLRDRLWRALRVQLDVELQTRGLSPEAGARRLVEALGFPPDQARAEVVWYSRAPGVPMAYATGWALINAAREHLQQADQRFTLKRFHDRLLGSGSIGLPLALESAFGARTAQVAHEAVFGVE